MSPFSMIEVSVRMYFSKMISPTVESIILMSALPQLRIDMEQLAKAGSDTIEIWAEMTRNTARSMEIPSSMRYTEYHTLYTGRNLRWEILGLMMSIAGINAQYLPAEDPLFSQHGRKLDKEEFIQDMIHAGNECIHLCQAHGAVNDIMVWLLYYNMLVTCNFYGDNCQYSNPRAILC